jgi:hypothetical protein
VGLKLVMGFEVFIPADVREQEDAQTLRELEALMREYQIMVAYHRLGARIERIERKL